MTTHLEHVPALEQYLTNAGVIAPGDAWIDALRQVPRHRFVPARAWATPQDSRPEHTINRDDAPERWWDAIYTNTAIVTQRANGSADVADTTAAPTSSLSCPHVSVEFLKLLDLAVHHRVLEIGTGTGWSAAMLEHRVGADHVTTIEVDPRVASTASDNLKAAGSSVEVLTGDGALGIPGQHLLDRVHVTCGVLRIPYAWVEQTRPGAVIVLPWTPPGGGWGYQVRLDVLDDGTAIGRIGPEAAFMLMRTHGTPAVSRGQELPSSSESLLHPHTVAAAWDRGFRVHLAATAPSIRVVDEGWTHSDEAASFWTTRLFDQHGDGWATARALYDEPTVKVVQAGGRRLWEEVQAAYMDWLRLGSPGPRRFGITVTPDGQHMWLDEPARRILQLELPASRATT